MRGTKHLWGANRVLISIRKIHWKIIVTLSRRLLLRIKLLLNTWVVVRLNVALIGVKKVVVIRVLRKLIHHLIVAASSCLIVSLIRFLI